MGLDCTLGAAMSLSENMALRTRSILRRLGLGPQQTESFQLRYFAYVRQVEFAAINQRRADPAAKVKRELIKELGTRHPAEDSSKAGSLSADPATPDPDEQRPRPIPCTVNGLALSGGGIRSAAVCLGALQALQRHSCIECVDYLSTVSGDGYIGASLSAGMSTKGGRTFPFGEDISDSVAVSHLRNYSNYLVPRDRSTIRNVAEVAAIVLRGLVANVVLVFATLLGAALITKIAYPVHQTLGCSSFAARATAGFIGIFLRDPSTVCGLSFELTLFLSSTLLVVLIAWALLRSVPWLDGVAGDSTSVLLSTSRALIIAIVVIAFLDLQPLAISSFAELVDKPTDFRAWLRDSAGPLAAFAGIVSALSSTLANFLKTSERASDWTSMTLRVATHVVFVVAALVLPVALWIAYLAMSAALINGWPILGAPVGWKMALALFCVTAAISVCLRPNGYSLHRFYRDRLSQAFVFGAASPGAPSPKPLDRLKLSDLVGTAGPYPIVNAALNVQGSKEANRRGRNADFFMFTPDFIGSDLTMYAPIGRRFVATADMERIDPRLDLATTMAISGGGSLGQHGS